MKITETAFTAYPVTNIAPARAFYESVLELRPSHTFGEGEHFWIEYDLGPSTFAILNRLADKWRPLSDGPAITFEVDDFEAAINRLKTHNVNFVLEPFKSPSAGQRSSLIQQVLARNP